MAQAAASKHYLCHVHACAQMCTFANEQLQHGHAPLLVAAHLVCGAAAVWGHHQFCAGPQLEIKLPRAPRPAGERAVVVDHIHVIDATLIAEALFRRYNKKNPSSNSVWLSKGT